ncbi:MAG: hypothetical protein RIR79_524 [Pseudomonadota bacterium]|jgi:hypothetical protein
MPTWIAPLQLQSPPFIKESGTPAASRFYDVILQLRATFPPEDDEGLPSCRPSVWNKICISPHHPAPLLVEEGAVIPAS